MARTNLQLVIDVSYKLNHTRVSELKSRLDRIANLAAGEGLFTGSTAAEVENWTWKVHQPKKEKS